MKKNYLIISLFILSMIFSFTFKPLNVKADPVTEPASEETTTNPTDENEDIDEKEKEEPEIKKTDGEEEKEEKVLETSEEVLPTENTDSEQEEIKDNTNDEPKVGLKASTPTKFDRTTASLEIKWDDNNNENGKRPKTISAILLANNSSASTLILDDDDNATHYSYITLNDDNNWVITVTNIPKYKLVYNPTTKKYELPKDDEGNEIREELTYSWNIKYNWEDGKEPTEDYKVTNTLASDILVDGNKIGVKTTMTNTYSPKETNVQLGKVLITKLDEDKNPLVGAKLQIINKATGEVVETWISDGTVHEIYLPAGEYILHEEEAPEGYILSEDKEFTVEIITDNNIHGDVIFNDEPCEHYGGTALYYVEVESVSYEVYCINQNWETPDGNSQYSGQIISETTIKDFTKQTTPVAIDSNDVRKYILSTDSETGKTAPIDVSEPSLNDQQLYDKLIDIIYHRLSFGGKIVEKDSNGNDIVYEYSEEEIRFITEVALKNYTNPGFAELQWNTNVTTELIELFDKNGVVYKRYRNDGTYVEDPNGTKLSYLKHNYRDYEYNENAKDNESIVKMVYGTGTSFGQMVAGHWERFHGANISGSASAKEARATVARYYKLFKLLISDENPHPKDMNLYIYSSLTSPLDLSGNDHEPNGKYQNLLGITGYHKDVEIIDNEVEMIDNYSTEKN